MSNTKPQALLALDYGEKTIGLAYWQEGIKMIIGRESIIYPPASSFNHLQWWNFIINKLKKIIKKDKIEKVILGLPKKMNNQESSITRTVRRFARYLQKEIKVPIILVDERLSSQEALKKGAQNLHQEAARIILENYLISTNLQQEETHSSLHSPRFVSS